MHTRTKLTLVALMVLLSSAMTCPPKDAELTPEQRAALRRLQVLEVVEKLQNTAIALNGIIDPETGERTLKDRDAVTIVTFTVEAAKVVRATPFGWEVTLRTAWMEVKTLYTPDPMSVLGLLFADIDAILEILGGEE